MLLLVAAAVFLWSDTPWDIDDALITYRYAENLAAGRGLTYNAGERVQGASTPLFTLLLAAAERIGIPAPRASNALGFAAALATVALTPALALRLTGSPIAAAFAGAMLLGHGAFVRYSMAGMESPLVALLTLSALLALADGRTLLAAGLAGLASFARLDGLALAAVVLLEAWRRRRRGPWREAAAVALALVPWLLFAQLYFGAVLPQSVAAKRQHLQELQESRFWIFRHAVALPLLSRLPLPLLAGLGALAALLSPPARGRYGPSLLFLAAYSVGYTLVGIPFYEWYLVPLSPVLAVLAAGGLSALARLLERGLNALEEGIAPARSAGIEAALAALLALAQLRLLGANVADFKRYTQTVEAARAEAGAWLRETTPPQARVLAGAIGHVGYASRRYIIDGAGLVTPLGGEGQPPPDYMVLSGSAEQVDGCRRVHSRATGWPFDPTQVSVYACPTPGAR